ncbi:MAG: glycosyltransferase [bacterium]|nr:glycosyltransferase [bacterium]
MKVLMLSEDPNIFVQGTEARERMKRYAGCFKSLHIVAPTTDVSARAETLGDLSLYPAYSRSAMGARVRLLRICFSLAARERFDIISAQSPDEIGFVGFLLVKIYNSRFQIQIHTDICSRLEHRSSWKARIRWWIAGFLIPRADCIRVVSVRIADSLVKQFKIQRSRVSVLPVFVDVLQIAGASPVFDIHKKYQFDFIILMVSRLSREKNIGMALRAFRKFLDEFPLSGLVIVGDGPELKNLQLMTNNLQLTNNVRFEGWQDDIVSYYKTADAYLLTSNFEGYGRSVVEASAAGCPVIMTDVGIAGDIIRNGESGRVVNPDDTEALIVALRDTRRSKEDNHKMAEVAKLALRAGFSGWGEYLKSYKETFIVCRPQ